MILSNTIKCNYCNDIIYSATVHDYKKCKCGKSAVDGGMFYLKRTGDNFTEMSIMMDDNLVYKLCESILQSQKTKRNALGILCAIMREIRDNNYQLEKKDGL